MTISSSLNAGVSGLSANATRLGTISDNIANASTFGYRRVETDFNSMVIGSNGGNYTAGGVRASTYRLISEGGSLVGTANATDIAIRGNGFIPVAQAAEVTSGVANPTMYLTSTGSFRPDAQGYLRTESGLMLLGWPADPNGDVPTYPRDTSQGLEPVRMGVNQLTAEPTTEITLGVNLPSTGSLADWTTTEFPLSLEYYDHLGGTNNLHVVFEPAESTVIPGTLADNTWRLTVYDAPPASGGTQLGVFRAEFDTSAGNGGALTAIALDPANVSGTMNGTMPQIQVDHGSYSQTINLFGGTAGSTDGLTQLGDTFAPLSIDRDGTEVGTMTSVEIDENGYVTAFFDNGNSRVIYQVPLADLANPNGMMALDRQVFMPTPESGGFVLWNAGSGPTGEIVAFAREESATDVAAELTDMIQTQRAYSSNAKVIQTVDEMLQETTNMKR